MSLGGDKYDYRPQIADALANANLPKSPLAQDVNNYMQSAAGGVFAGLMNSQAMGNAFRGNGANGSNNTFSFPLGQGIAQNPAFYSNYGQQSLQMYPNGNPTPATSGSAGATAGSPNTYPPQQTQGAQNTYAPYQGATNPNAQGSSSPNIPGYSGGFTPVYGTVGGVDVSQYLGQGLRLSDLVSRGIISQAQLNSQFGKDANYDPYNDPANRSNYQQFLADASNWPNVIPGTLPDFNTWVNQYTAQGSNLDAYAPNDEAGLQQALANLPKQQNGGYVNSSGQYIPPSTEQRYLQNGQYYNNLQQAITAMQNGQNNGVGSGALAAQYANPYLSPLSIQGQNAGALNTLSQFLSGPQLNNYNPAAQALGGGQFQGQIGQAQLQGIPGLAQAIQQALGQGASQVQAPNLAGGGAANLSQLNLENANLQAANPQQVNAANAQLNLPQIGNVNQTAMDSDYYRAVQDIMQNKQTNDINDLRARFTAGGTSRGTPAAFAEAQLRSQQVPEIAAALGQIRQSEIGNALQGQQNQISGANAGNNALLQARQQDIGNAQQNVQNLLQAAGLNNNANLQARQQNLDLLGLGQQGQLQNQGMLNEFLLGGGAQNLQAQLANQQAAGGNLSALLGQFNNQQNLDLQNYYNSVNANLNQGGLLNNLLGQAGQQNLGLQQLGSQNYLGAAGLNSQNANNILSNQNNYLSTILGAQNQNNNLLSQLAQFNAQQGNQYNLQMQAQQQAANESQIGRQFTGIQNLLSGLLALAGAGTPGGSANVNLNAAPVGKSGGFESLLGSLGGLF